MNKQKAINIIDDEKLEQLVAKHCERYVNVKLEGKQDKHDAEIATLKSELLESKMEMEVLKTELEKQRKQIETLTTYFDQSTRTEHLSDSRETLTAKTSTNQTAPEYHSDLNIDQSNKLKLLTDSTTEVLSAKISQHNRFENAAEGSIQSGETLTREVGSKVVETTNVDDKQAPPSIGVRIQRDVHRVAFFAYLAKHADGLGQNQDIAFEHVVTNIGNAYNGNHGVFIAPVQGTYVFSCTLLFKGSAVTWGHFVVNHNVVAKFGLSTYEQASHTIVVTLNAGDDVSVQNTYANRSITGDSYSTFSGFLLFESGSEEIIG